MTAQVLLGLCPHYPSWGSISLLLMYLKKMHLNSPCGTSGHEHAHMWREACLGVHVCVQEYTHS